MAEETHCVFCKIIKGEFPSFKVYEDNQFIVILDKFPRATGHCLVIPKKHYRWVWDVPEIGQYMEITKKIALAQRKAFGTDMIASHIVGDEVPHAHIWLIPNLHTKNQNLNNDDIVNEIKKYL